MVIQRTSPWDQPVSYDYINNGGIQWTLLVQSMLTQNFDNNLINFEPLFLCKNKTTWRLRCRKQVQMHILYFIYCIKILARCYSCWILAGTCTWLLHHLPLCSTSQRHCPLFYFGLNHFQHWEWHLMYIYSNLQNLSLPSKATFYFSFSVQHFSSSYNINRANKLHIVLSGQLVHGWCIIVCTSIPNVSFIAILCDLLLTNVWYSLHVKSS